MGRVGMIVGGRYRLQQVLGCGGKGTVHAAEDLLLARRVALRLGHARHVGDDAIALQYRREAAIGTRVVHRNVAGVVDAGTTSHRVPFIVMEYAPGRMLSRLLARRTLTLRRIASIAEQLLAGLDAIHRAGFVHADLKTDNVVVDVARDDVVKVVDLGLAHACVESDAPPLGTPAPCAPATPYVAPEVAAGSGSRARSDIYASGVIIYEMLVGQTPFGGLDPAEIVHRQVHHEIAAPSQRSFDLAISAGLDEAVMKALARDASDRYATAGAFAEAIAAAVRELPAEDESGCLAAGTITDEWNRPQPTTERIAPVAPVAPVDPFGPQRGALAHAIQNGVSDDIIATCLELVSAYLDRHRCDAASAVLEHTLAILTNGRPPFVGGPACWRLALPLAALYDGCGEHARARALARTAREHALTSGSYIGTLRADQLIARLTGRRRAVPSAVGR